jgi:hypothetical protein
MTTEQNPAPFTRAELLAALDRFIRQRSGLDPRNYGDRESLLMDYRPILRDGKVARKLLRFVEIRESITADMLLEGTRAFSGRLQFIRDRKGNCVVDYCTGQYFPVEYRRAACCVLARTIQEYLFPDAKDNADIRQKAKREFGRAIATRYF